MHAKNIGTQKFLLGKFVKKVLIMESWKSEESFSSRTKELSCKECVFEYSGR